MSPDTRELMVYAILGACAAAVVMALLHETHYRGRRERIEDARARGRDLAVDASVLGLVRALEERVTELETIAMEDRET